MDISIVLPVYEERENIGPLIDEIECAMAATGRTYEIICVDDGSRDGSREVLRKLAAERPHVRGLLFRRNWGQTAAFDAGFRAAIGDVVVTLDADGQNDPADIPAMLRKLDEGYDVITGWRKQRQDGMVLRKVPSRIANWGIRKITGTKVHDLGCSLKVYRRAITDEMRLYGEMHRFISVIAGNLGANVGEVEVNHRPRTSGKSKYGLRRTVKVLLDLITVVFLGRYHTKPIYVFGGMAFSTFALGSLIFAVVLWQKFANGAWVHRNPLFGIGAFCFLIGVQLLGTGVIAEMVARTYFESQGKTVYSIAERVGGSANQALDQARSK